MHRFNIDTMIAVRQFDDVSRVLDDSTIEAIFDNLDSLDTGYEKCLIRWVRTLQEDVFSGFALNVDKEFACLKTELRKQLVSKEKQIESRIRQAEAEKERALDHV